MHFKAWYPHTHRTTLLSRSKKGTRRCALSFDDVIGVVAECLTGFELRELPDNTVALNHKRVAVCISNDPFATKDVHRFIRAIVDRDMIHKWMRSIWRSRASRIIRDVIYDGTETGQMFKADIHKRSVTQSVVGTRSSMVRKSETKNHLPRATLKWRTERDSNPRYRIRVHTLSRRARSTTLASVHFPNLLCGQRGAILPSLLLHRKLIFRRVTCTRRKSLDDSYFT